jgi:hypothetical protein
MDEVAACIGGGGAGGAGDLGNEGGDACLLPREGDSAPLSPCLAEALAGRPGDVVATGDRGGGAIDDDEGDAAVGWRESRDPGREVSPMRGDLGELCEDITAT